MLPDGLNRLRNLAGSSKNHHRISISCIFLQFPHQVDVKNVVKCWKDFLSYFTTLETYRVISHIKLVIFLITNLEDLLKKQVLLLILPKSGEGIAPRPLAPCFHRPWLHLSFRFTRGLVVAIGPIFIVIVSA